MSDIQNPKPKQPLVNRVLLGVVIFLGLLIVAAFLALVYGAFNAFSKHGAAPPPSVPSLQNLPKGAQIVDMKVDGGRTVVRLHTANGDEIDIFDTETGQLVTRIAPPK